MNTRILSLIAVAIIAPLALWYWMQYCGARMLDTDYATVGTGDMFQRVIGFPVPAGITVDTVAGHHGGGVGMVWMKMNGNDKVFDILTAKMVPLDKGFHYTIPSGFGVQKTFGDDARAAGWDQVPQLQKPQMYLFQTSGGGEHWNGNLVIDRPNHSAYLSASLNKSAE